MLWEFSGTNLLNLHFNSVDCVMLIFSSLIVEQLHGSSSSGV